jgi:hypothetical protein
MKRQLALVLAALVATPASADEAAFLACRKVTDSLQRLVCYDSVPTSSAVPASGQAPVAPAKRPAAVEAPSEPARAAPENFGLPDTLVTGSAEVKSIDAVLADEVRDWQAQSMMRLTNGQVWQVGDESSGQIAASARQVLIRRGLTGAFYMKIDGVARPIRVTRVK